MSLQLRVKKLHPNATVPRWATEGAACFDLHAVLAAPVEITQSDPMVLNTGLAFEVPDGYALMVYSRSGHGFKNNVRLANAVGVVDADYRGEVKVKLSADGKPYTVSPNERIAQAMLIPIPRVTLVEVAELSSTERSAGGFGSSGK